MVLLSYIGGKNRIAQKIASHIPADVRTIVSPFFGAGSVEFLCAMNGKQVIGYDIFPELVNFWQQLKLFPAMIAIAIEKLIPISKEMYRHCRQTNDNDPFAQAVNFFVVNKCSFNGIMSGSYSPALGNQFSNSPKHIRRFSYPDGLSVSVRNFPDAIKAHPAEFLFLDPPYFEINKTYGFHGEFSEIDHELLACLLEQHPQKWLLLYNDHPHIRDRYKKYVITELESRYSSNRAGAQLLITNFTTTSSY